MTYRTWALRLRCSYLQNKRRIPGKGGNANSQEKITSKESPLPSQYFIEPIRPSHLRVVCDGSLQGLSKRLRLYGVDSVTIESFEPLEHCGEIARRDDRMILTRAIKSCDLFKRFVSPGRCLRLQNDLALDDMVRDGVPVFVPFVPKSHSVINFLFSPEDRCCLQVLQRSGRRRRHIQPLCKL